MAISKRLRYEVFRRDNHACRYCGATAPDAKLTIDHVIPVTLGGTDEPANLVTACTECNTGKSATSPDAPIVADISADAIRWGKAMQEAASFMLRDREERLLHQERFGELWNNWTYGSKYNRQTLPMPAGWGNSVDSLLAAGLPFPVLAECIDLAMAAKHVHPDDTFRYMCGIAWRKIAELREIAGSLLEVAGPQPPNDCGHAQPPGPCTLCAAGVPPRRREEPEPS